MVSGVQEPFSSPGDTLPSRATRSIFYVITEDCADDKADLSPGWMKRPIC